MLRCVFVGVLVSQALLCRDCGAVLCMLFSVHVCVCVCARYSCFFSIRQRREMLSEKSLMRLLGVMRLLRA